MNDRRPHVGIRWTLGVAAVACPYAVGVLRVWIEAGTRYSLGKASFLDIVVALAVGWLLLLVALWGARPRTVLLVSVLYVVAEFFPVAAFYGYIAWLLL